MPERMCAQQQHMLAQPAFVLFRRLMNRYTTSTTRCAQLMILKNVVYSERVD
jgi:hypothetical protein